MWVLTGRSVKAIPAEEERESVNMKERSHLNFCTNQKATVTVFTCTEVIWLLSSFRSNPIS